MTASVVNVAVVGLGRMGRIYAHALAHQVAGARLYAIADPNEPARAAVLADIDVPHTLPDFLSVLDLPDLHAVVIATPTSTHPELVSAAARAGKAIFCEKPLALTLAETHTALAAVERAGVPLQVGFMRRFDAGYRQAHAMIAEGRIGRPLTFKAIGRDYACPPPEYANPSRSGGLIIDMGIHDFDLARWLMHSEVERVSAEGALLVCAAIRAVGDIDNAVINLRFTSGALGNVEVSRNATYGYDIRTEILGSEGAISIGAYQQTPLVLLTRSGYTHDIVPHFMQRFGDAYRDQLVHFVACLRQDRLPAVGGADALAALEISVAATRAYETGQPVSVAEVRTEERA